MTVKFYYKIKEFIDGELKTEGLHITEAGAIAACKSYSEFYTKILGAKCISSSDSGCELELNGKKHVLEILKYESQ